MASSDIIKIGFDYRSSLAQFEKDTNGVFDGISSKAGKQKITIQLDAKDDKVIDKIKELQKLKLDKFTFEFGNSGLKEQLQTFDKLENKINEIINLGKGKSFIDSSSTVADIGKIVQKTNNQAKAIDKVTNSYKNQAYELASVLKMLAKLDQYGDVPYAEAFSKAVKSGAKSYKNGDDIQFAAKKYGMDEESIKYLRGLSVNLSNAFNYTDTLGLDTANITNVEKLTEYFRELLKEKLEFNNTKLNTSDIEELIKALGIAKKELFDDGTKSGRNIYGDGTLDKYSDLPQIIQYLKQQETQAIATAEAEQKLAEAQKETASNTSNSNNSQIEELKSDIQEVKTELGDVKDRISSIESNGFENVREDVEKTKESVKELNSELTEMKSNLSSTPQESNISSGNTNPPSPPKKDRYAKRRKISEEDFLNYSPNRINEKLSNSGYTILGETVNTELVDGLVKVSAKIKDADGAWKSFSAKVDADGNIFEQRFKTVTNGVDKLETALENFGRETSPALTYQETLDKAQKIKNSLNLGDEYSIKVDSSEFVTITKKLTDVENAGASVTQTFKSAQDAIDNFGKAASNSAEKTSVALKSVKNKDMKDAFPDKDVSSSVESATNAIKEENNILDQNTRKIKENTQAKEQNSNATINKYDRRLDNYQGKMNGYENTLRKFSEGGWTSKDYLNNVIAVKDALSDYENAINSIKEKGFITQDDIQSLDRYEAKLKETIYVVQNMSASQKGYILVSGQKELDKIDRLLEENTNLTRQAKEQIRAYYNEIASGNPSASLDIIHGKILEIINDEKEAGRGGKRFIDTLNNKAFYNFAQQLGTMFSFYDVINGVKQASSAVIQLNSDIIDLAKVSEATSSQIYADFNSYADIAKEIGGTISDTISATADWSKNGYSIPDAKQLAEISQLYKNVGDGIDIDTANESLISTLKGFQLEADQAEHIVDVFNEVDLLASYYSNVIALCIHMHIDSNYIG